MPPPNTAIPYGEGCGRNLFPSKFAYSHSGFYKASMVKDCDIFRCVEDGQLYVPSGDGLRHYNERPDLKGAEV